jgi:hypothetical protein
MMVARGNMAQEFDIGNIVRLTTLWPFLSASERTLTSPSSGAGHVISPLAFSEETSQNRFSRSMAWVTPRCGLVPASAETEAGTIEC